MRKHVFITSLNHSDSRIIRALWCDDFLSRMRGLMLQHSLPVGEGILLIQKRDSVIDTSIHMLFMWMDLAVVWINSSFRVVDTRLARRWRLAYFSRAPARYVLEMSPENLDYFKIGDQVVIYDESLQ